MITVLAIVGAFGFLGLVIGAVLYLFDAPQRHERLRMEVQAQDAAWRIQQHTRRAVEQMLSEARRQRGE